MLGANLSSVEKHRARRRIPPGWAPSFSSLRDNITRMGLILLVYLILLKGKGAPVNGENKSDHLILIEHLHEEGGDFCLLATLFGHLHLYFLLLWLSQVFDRLRWRH